mmetsp:Transcript_8172/g.17666  ORF Transcript_8172/g.17666 Transcript_8172/m.17666 type:complete len:682 (-) Transcript_8172:184-2229(-)
MANKLTQRTKSIVSSSSTLSSTPSSLYSINLSSSEHNHQQSTALLLPQNSIHSSSSSNNNNSGNHCNNHYSLEPLKERQSTLSSSKDDDEDDTTMMKSSPMKSFLQQQTTKISIGFTSLANSPPELSKAYLLKFLDSYSYFSFSLIFTLFLSEEFGMSDVRAGTIYGAWGALITVFGLFTGTVIDRLGVAKCLRIGFVLSFLSRLMILCTTSEGILLMNLLISLPFSNCLGIPVLTVGIRRYTNEENRGFAFGLFYVVMNVGALVAGPLVDYVTLYYNGQNEEHGMENNDAMDTDGTTTEDADAINNATMDSAATSLEWSMNANRAVILSGVVANFIAVIVAFTVREIKVDASSSSSRLESTKYATTSSSSTLNADENNEQSNNNNNGGSNNAPKIKEFQPIQGSSYEILWETMRTPNFRRFLVVCLLTINVRMVFRHLDGTLPKYMIREFGENTPKGRVYAINPAIIIFLVPIVTAATTAVDPLLMIHRGTYVSALSVFFLAFSTSLPACVMFVITLSIGEAIWSPRLYDYTMSVAQEGREGTYMALSSAPLFLAKLPVGFLSGVLLQKYCPETMAEGEVRHSKTMWWIIGLTTIVSPILITLLWGYISGGEDGEGGGGVVRKNSHDGRAMNHHELLMAKDEDDGFVQEDVDSSEHSYQHRPLTSNISLPRVRSTERPIV